MTPILWSSLYYLSRFKNVFFPLVVPFKIAVLALATFFWFNSGGMDGVGVGLFPSIVIGFIIISPNPNYISIILKLSCFFLLLILSDIYFADWFINHTSVRNRYLDLAISILMSFFTIGLTYGMLKTKFKTAKANLYQKNKELEQANLLKSQFISNINHELRTPMNGIVGMLSLLEKTPISTEQNEYIQAIQLSGERLLNIVNEILDFSNLSTIPSQPTATVFALQDLVEQVLVINAHEATQKGLYLLYDIDPKLSNYEWKGDLDRIQRVLSNLTNNAIKFTHKGEVIIHITEKQPNWLTFSITDTGIGIATDKIDDLFTPFTQLDGSNTRQFGGTGLGLAISKKFIDLLGGSIDIKSQGGQGSTFSFSIPIEKQTTFSVQNQADDLKSKNIALLSPHPVLAKVITNWLSPRGTKVHWLQDTKSLYQHIAQHQTDLVLLDCKTAHLNPLELANSFSNIPLILIQSGNKRLSKEDSSHYFSCLLTPLRYEKICNCIQKALNAKNASTDIPQKEPILQYSKILVVDDDRINRKLLEKMLLKLGYVADTANNGQEAINKTTNNHYQLILMDLQMPILDGFGASTQIIEQYANNGHNNCPKIVAITANALKTDKAKCFEIGMDDYLTKPITSNDLQKLFYKFRF